MQAFQASLQPSRLLRRGVLLLHGLALAVVWRYFDGKDGLALSVACLASAAWAWQQNGRRAQGGWVGHIEVDTQGRVTLVFVPGGSAVQAQLLSGSLISRYGLWLKWRIGDEVVWRVLLPDMTDADSYRRLVVWARWHPPPDADAADV